MTPTQKKLQALYAQLNRNKKSWLKVQAIRRAIQRVKKGIE